MTPASYREKQGLTIEQAAKKARVSVDYLKRVERRGYPPPCLSSRLSRLYAMSEDEWYTVENFPATMKAKAKSKAEAAAKAEAKIKAKAEKRQKQSPIKGPDNTRLAPQAVLSQVPLVAVNPP